jgi:hypothetical protein
MECKAEFNVSEVRRLRFRLAEQKKRVFVMAIAGYGAGLTGGAAILSVPHINQSIATRWICAATGLIYLWLAIHHIHDHLKIRKWRAELYADMETQLADFKREIEAKGINPVTSAGIIMRAREELTRLIP